MGVLDVWSRFAGVPCETFTKGWWYRVSPQTWSWRVSQRTADKWGCPARRLEGEVERVDYVPLLYPFRFGKPYGFGKPFGTRPFAKPYGYGKMSKSPWGFSYSTVSRAPYWGV